LKLLPYCLTQLRVEEKMQGGIFSFLKSSGFIGFLIFYIIISVFYIVFLTSKLMQIYHLYFYKIIQFPRCFEKKKSA